MPDTPALQADTVTKRYGHVIALRGVSLRVAAGECLALVGESGSGKTTLLRAFNRMVEPEAGRVLVNGRDVAGEDPVALRRSIGYVQQEGGLLPHWSVRRNAALVPWLRRDDDALVRADHVLVLVGLDPATFADRRPRQLSGGQRQRVAIARALADRPSILLMDEPFGALDAITRAELHESFEALRAEIPTTTLLVTHDLREAARLADRIAVMRAGGIEQVAAPAELVEAPSSAYVAMLLHRAGLR
ncbi:MAG: ATP-binding cassette domain-containing protein [Gemmatimonadetes bacterium]|nr:ATP-binding cassette domain-containing protein [Gemmatimonadota bacterium]